MNLAMSNIKPGIERFMNNMDSFSDKLIQSGWTINMEMMPYHINEISEIIDISDIDDFFYSYFMDNDHKSKKHSSLLKEICGTFRNLYWNSRVTGCSKMCLI